MTDSEANTLPLGLYVLYWRSGGTSLASVGQDAHGNRWYSPINWISVPGWNWNLVEKVKRVDHAEPDDPADHHLLGILRHINSILASARWGGYSAPGDVIISTEDLKTCVELIDSALKYAQEKTA